MSKKILFKCSQLLLLFSTIVVYSQGCWAFVGEPKLPEHIK